VKILALDTSCDDTAVALVEKGRRVLFSLSQSQVKIHSRYGGIVPEVAAREHLRVIFSLLRLVLKKASNSVDALAVTEGPGLVGSLLVGLSVAQALSYLWKKKVFGVNHLQAHLYANWLGKAKEEEPQFPALGLVVSGGHTDLVLMRKQGQFKLLGATRDDAVGESFDKVARILGLGYPGGPVVEQAARGIRPNLSFPVPMQDSIFDVSLSGLKTAVLYAERTKKYSRFELAAAFQNAVLAMLADKVRKALKKYKAVSLLLGGGVVANKPLRNTMKKVAAEFGVDLFLPRARYCLDNAAMVAAAAYWTKVEQRLGKDGTPWYNLSVKPNEEIASEKYFK